MDDLNPFSLDYREPEPVEFEFEAPVDAPRTEIIGVSHMASADYHSDPAPEPSLSATLAKLVIGKSPLHAWHASPRLNPNWEPIEKKTFDIGRAAHRGILGAGDDYCAIPDELLSSDGKATTKAAKEFVAECREAGRTPLKQSEIDQVEAMVLAAERRLAERGIILDPSRSELAAIARVDGTYCRAMLDNVPAPASEPIYDYKTCEDASPEACLRAVLRYGYDIQAEHYRAVWKAATGEDRQFVFIFQEKPAPHEITLIRLSGSFEEMAQRRAAKARKLWAECIRTNNWPGYPAGLHEVDPPAWLVERELMEEYA